MKTFKKSLLAFTGLLMLLGLQSCFNKVDPPELPPITETGANTLGFRIDGEIWVPLVTCLLCNDKELCIEHTNNSVRIAADRRISGGAEFSGITFNIDSAYVGELFTAPDLLDIGLLGGGLFNPQFDRPGTFLITRYDTVANVVSGQFEFFMSQPGGPVIEITEGRFDVEIGHCR